MSEFFKKVLIGIICLIIGWVSGALTMKVMYDKEKETTENFAKTLNTSIQAGIDAGMSNVKADFREAIKQSIKEELEDNEKIKNDSAALDDVGVGWVPVSPGFQTCPEVPAIGSAESRGTPATAATVRAQLSREASDFLKRESARADNLAKDYNKLYRNYQALIKQTYGFNQRISELNAQIDAMNKTPK